MRVNREQFIQNLQSVQAGLASKEIVEQSTCFVFKDGEIITFNDELSCRIPSMLEKDFAGAVPAQRMLENLTKWTDEEVDIEAKDGELLISGKRNKSGVRLEKEITLPVGAVEKPKEWKKLPDDFSDAINIVQQCTGKDESKFHLTCVHIHPNWLEASDNFQVCRWNVDTGIKTSTLVRQSAIKHLVSLGMSSFSETPSWIHFKNSKNLIISCRRYVEEYPNLDNHLNVGGGTLINLPKGLVEATDAAQVFSSESSDSNYVAVYIKPGWVNVKGEGSSGWFKRSIKIEYSGEAFSFLISPNLLMDIVKRHSECQLTANRLKVDGGKYQYISCLGKIPEKENGKKKTDKPKPTKDKKEEKNASAVVEKPKKKVKKELVEAGSEE